MTKTSETIVFFGSGPVAAESLRLLAQDFTIEAVVTKPQPDHHKQPFPVLELANELGLKTFTPNSKAELSDLFTTKPVKSRLGIVIDYGFIINQDVIDYFPLGIVNSHFSLLPQWRGADPITFSILSGQSRTGVSLMVITAGMDEGPLLGQASLDLDGTETTPQLTDKLISLSHDLLKQLLPAYIAGTLQPTPQDPVLEPSYSRKLTKEDGLVDWHKPAATLEREIRAFIEWPKSRMQLAGKDVVITSAHVVPEQGDAGTVVRKGKLLLAYCGSDALSIDKLKPAGKNEMAAQAFLAGYGHLLNSK